MVLFFNGDNVSSVLENEYWISYWGDDADTEIQFIYDDYDNVENILEFLDEQELDYRNDDHDEKIEKILFEKLGEKHFSAYEYFDKNSKVLIEKVMSGLLEEYPAIKAKEEEWFEEGEEMPSITSIEDMKNYISPLRIYFHEDGNIGIGFDCEWEEEHGLGVLFNENDGVIEIGDYPVAF